MSLIPNLPLRGVSQALSLAKVYWLMSTPGTLQTVPLQAIQEYMLSPANVRT